MLRITGVYNTEEDLAGGSWRKDIAGTVRGEEWGDGETVGSQEGKKGPHFATL